MANRYRNHVFRDNFFNLRIPLIVEAYESTQAGKKSLADIVEIKEIPCSDCVDIKLVGPKIEHHYKVHHDGFQNLVQLYKESQSAKRQYHFGN